MKALAVAMALVAGLAVSGCGSTETAQQVVADASTKMAALKALRYDISGEVNSHTQIPGQAGSSLKAFVPTDMKIKFDGTGSSVLPGANSVDIHETIGDTTTRVRAITVGDSAYFTNPSTGSWFKVPSSAMGLGASANGQLSQLDPSNANQYLKNAKSVTDLGETTLDGARVHHYRIFVDPEKLKSTLATAGAKAPALAGLLGSINIKSYRIETWIGTGDHLLHQVQTDYAMASVTSTPSPAPPGCVPFSLQPTPAAGRTVCPPDLSGFAYESSGSLRMKFHDFNARISITPPPNAQPLDSAFSQLFAGAAGGASAGLKPVVPSPSP